MDVTTVRSLSGLKRRLWVRRALKRVVAYDPAIPIDRAIQEEKHRGFAHSFRWMVTQMGRTPDPRWSVLEAGHGSSGYARFYAQIFDHVTGVDVKDYALFHPRVNSIVADLTEYVPLMSDSIDLIVSHSVLEHVSDVTAALKNLDRLLRVGGYVYLTVFGLYFSAKGGHVRTAEASYENWEHLDPASEHYLSRLSPNSKHAKAAHLNQYRFSDFMAAFARFPWEIERVSRSYDERVIPAWVDTNQIDEIDLRTRGFRMVARKVRHFA